MAQRVVCVVGPTASGKTKMGVALAKRFGKRIITLDHGVVASDTAPAPMEDDEEVAAQ